jgi:hypothetical protein
MLIQGVRSHSASDIFNGNDVQSDDEEIKGQRFSYHGSIDENALGVEEYKRRPSISSPPQALQRKVFDQCLVESCFKFRISLNVVLFFTCRQFGVSLDACV